MLEDTEFDNDIRRSDVLKATSISTASKSTTSSTEAHMTARMIDVTGTWTQNLARSTP